MPREGNEPQSYGSEADWQSGRTGQQIHDPKAPPPPEHADFYESRREEETDGGSVSPVQLAENSEPQGLASGADVPVQKVTAKESGAKRGSYFRKRDYE